MSVSATPSVSHLPLEWAGAIVPGGDAQAFDLAINDAGKALDQGLASPPLGAPVRAPAVDALTSGLSLQKWMPGMRQPASLPAEPSMEGQELDEQVQGLSKVPPELMSGAGLKAGSMDDQQVDQPLKFKPMAGETLKGQSQGLAQVTPGLLSGAGLNASSEDEQQADQDIQAAAGHNVAAQLQAAQSTASNKPQTQRSPLPRQDIKRPEDESVTTRDAGAAMTPLGSEPMGSLGNLAGPEILPPELGSSSTTPAKTPRGREAPAEAESGLPGEKDSKTHESLGDPAQLFAVPSSVQSASRVVADSPPVASDGNAAASDIAVPDGAPASYQDNAVVPGQQRPIDAAGFAASMPDNNAGAVQPGLNRQDANVATADQPGAPVLAAPAAQPTATALQTSRGLGKGLALEMRKSIEDGREHMRVRLDPKELGQLDVRLSFEKDGALRAIITASTSASNDLLRQELPTLVRNLSDAGVRMDAGSLRFELQSGSGGSSGQRQTFQDERQPSSRNGSREDTRTEEDAVFGTRPWRARGQFDLRA